MAARPAPRYAVISVGTNSCRFLIAAERDGVLRTEYHETRGTRLGEGVQERKRLDEEAVERTLAAVREYAGLARGVRRTFAIGTSALRDARNADKFGARFEELAGTPIAILSGDEEALSSFSGVLSGMRAAGRPEPGPLCVIDVGGGSTEFAVRKAAGVEPCVASVQMGAVRLTERFMTTDPPTNAEVQRCREAVRAHIAALPQDVQPLQPLVAVGGTANTAARMLQAMEENGGDPKIADVAVDDLSELLKATLAMPVAQRKRLRGLPEQRADIFPAGLMIIGETARATGARDISVSQSDLLLGYLARSLPHHDM